MTTVKVRTPGGGAKGVVELPAGVFDVEPNIPLMHQVVIAQLAAARAGTHSTKTRGQVRGGGAKPYRQKGTGRARQGSIRAPQFAGGGVVHGPTPRDYSQRTPKKMKAAALRGALSDRARAGRVHVVSAVLTGDTPSTKAARKALATITELPKVLVVLDREDEMGWLSLRNLPNVHLIAPDQLNTYDVLVNDEIVFSSAGLEAFLAAPEREPAAPERQPAAAADEPAAESPFGPGSHAPLPDGSQPDGHPIKGNASSKLYHVPGSGFYTRTAAEVWFDSAESAEAAGFQLPPSQRKSSGEEAEK